MRSLPRAIRQTRCFSFSHVYRETSSNELGKPGVACRREPIRIRSNWNWNLNWNLSGYFVEEEDYLYLHATNIAGKGKGYSAPSFSCFVFTRRPFSSTVSTTDSDIIIATSPEETPEEKEAEKAGPLVEYQRRIASGDLIEGDHFQVDTIQLLQRLYDELIQKEDDCQLDRYTSSKKAARSRWLWSRLIPQSTYAPVKGLYLYGGVGTGKTMLMDLFYEQLPSDWRKKRTHFHDFMLHVHSHLQMHKGVADPLEVVAAEISDEAIILCLDEFMVSDVADALILNRLFRHLFSKGVILVSTSNRAPDNLYEGGLQRDLFLPFIENLKERCIVHEIGSSVDYRKMGSAEQGYYFVGSKYNQLLKQKFQELVGDEEPRPHAVHVIMGRKLEVPLGANGCVYFQFEDLCDKPLGVADYWGLFEKFHTLALEGVPKFGISNRTAAYRFVALVDVLYEKRGRLLCTAEAPPVELFESIVTVSDAMKMSPRSSSRSQKNDDLDLCVDNELGFAKDRTISRLTELNSREYLEEFEANLKQQSRAVEA